MKELVTIIIIAHKELLSQNEKESLIQCYRVLNKYPIKIICPHGLNVNEYKNLVPQISIVFIDPKWQSNYRMFNELKKSELLYEKFKNYNFLLFYELDAWVFRDELAYWCIRSYDYVGAPWFEGWHEAGKSSKIIGIGNGGFSLRNIRSSIRLLKRVKTIRSLRKFWFISRLQAIWPFYKMLSFCKRYFHIRDISNIHDLIFEHYNQVNEDYFWTKLIAETFDDYKLATIEDAITFSFDVNPALLYQKNNHRLPFGCHAWERYEPEFWKPFILNKE